MAPASSTPPFSGLYGENIPPSTLWVKFIDMLEHVYGYVLLNDREDAPPKPGVNVSACAQHLCYSSTTDANGAFSRRLEEGAYWLAVEDDAKLIGCYSAKAPGNFTTDRDAATIINLAEDITDIEITLP